MSPSRKPRIFIASASESIDVANAINVNLDHDAEVTVWKHGFGLTNNTLDTLIKLCEGVDFAIFVFTPDDITNIRNDHKKVVRDNVVFELGLFTGSLGKERCFIIKPRSTDLHLPSDLLGLTPADYDGQRSDNNLEAALNTPCTLIKKEMLRLGLVSDASPDKINSRRKTSNSYTLNETDHMVLAKTLESHTCSPEGVPVWMALDTSNDKNKVKTRLSIIKLERADLVERKITRSQDGEYFSLLITETGIDYLLSNEHLFAEQPKAESVMPDYSAFDDDIPF